MEVLDLPVPFIHVVYSRSHGSLNHIPLVLLLAELLRDFSPGLLEMCHLIWWPAVVKGVNGLDVVQDDLVFWVNVFVAVQNRRRCPGGLRHDA